MTGAFITFEGMEGVGKSTQVHLLAERLRAHQQAVYITREPGGTPLAENLRMLFFQHAAASSLTEMLLLYAARIDHVEKIIQPKRNEGTYVLCDRFDDATQVYQAQNINETNQKILSFLSTHIAQSCLPDITFIFVHHDIDAVHQRKMRQNTTLNRFDQQPSAYHAHIQQCYINLALENKNRCILIDASSSPHQVHQEVWQHLHNRQLLTSPNDDLTLP